MKENILLEKSKEFAITILNLCDSIKNCNTVINQISRSGTSIGANVCEAQYAQSRADFIAKLRIALKECIETEYWLELLYKTNRIDEILFKTIRNDAGVIRKLIIKSCQTTKTNIDK